MFKDANSYRSQMYHNVSSGTFTDIARSDACQRVRSATTATAVHTTSDTDENDKSVTVELQSDTSVRRPVNIALSSGITVSVKSQVSSVHCFF